MYMIKYNNTQQQRKANASLDVASVYMRSAKILERIATNYRCSLCGKSDMLYKAVVPAERFKGLGYLARVFCKRCCMYPALISSDGKVRIDTWECIKEEVELKKNVGDIDSQ